MQIDGQDVQSGDVITADAYELNVGIERAKLTIEATPLAAFDGSASVEVSIAPSKDGQAIAAAHTVELSVSVAKKTITFDDLSGVSYRMQDDQLAEVKSQLEQQAASQYADGDSDVISVADVSFSGAYPGEAGGTVDVVNIALNDSASAAQNYALGTSTVSVSIDPVASSTLPSGFVLTTEGGATADESTWVNQDVSASYEGHVLASVFNGTYEATYAMPSAEGSYTGQVLYAKDNSSKVITKIEGIAFNLDKTAPVVRTFSVSDPQTKRDGIFFYKTVCDVSIAVSDAAGETMASGDGASPDVSGLVSDGAQVTYVDSHDSVTRAVDGFEIEDDTLSGMFSFTIDGDQDVKTNSFSVTAQDLAGNVMQASTADALQIPSDVLELVADSAAPSLSVSFDNNAVFNGSYYKANRTATFTITEANFQFLQQYDPTQTIVSISENGQTRVFNPGSFTEVGKDTWQATYTFSNDADYIVSAQVTDLVGKSSERYDTSFTIDKTNPVLSVSFDNNNAQNGKYYAAARTATVTVVEHNFSGKLVSVSPTSGAGNGSEVGAAQVSSWKTDGDVHVATVRFPGQGVYTLSVGGEDLASNAMESYACSEFVVDTIKPVVSVQVNGDTDASSHAYAGTAPVSVTIEDTNADGASSAEISAISWNSSGSPYALEKTADATKVTFEAANPALDPASDGVYRITVNAVDMAGNTESKVVDWSVNRFGSTYILTGDTPQMIETGYLQDEGVHDVTVKEINPSGLQEDETSVQLTLGTSNSVLEKGSDYTFGGGQYEGWPAYDYAINRDNFGADGTYQLTLHSLDNASHASENTMSGKSADRTSSADIVFTVDNTNPICTFSGFDEGEVADSSHTVQVNLEDNIALKKAVIEYGDGQVIDVDDVELARSKIQSVTLGESNQDQVVKVTVTDMAGNEEVYESNSIFVNSNFFARLVHNTVAFVGSILGVAALLAAAGFGFYLLKRRKKEGTES